MNTEKLILKGVETKLIGGRTFFKVESLNEHFDGLVIYESDWVQVEDEAYVVLSDVNFDNATDNEIQRKSEVAEEVNEGMTFEEAEKELNAGYLVALPEWEGFWFKNLNVENVQDGEILVLTKDGEVINTPWEESKERNDWITVDATPEQQEILDNYFAVKQGPVDFSFKYGETILDENHFQMLPGLAESGFKVGDTLICEEGSPLYKKEDVPAEETEVIEPEVVEPEIVAPEVIVAETPTEEDDSSPYSIAPVGTPAEIEVIEEVVAPVKTKKSKK